MSQMTTAIWSTDIEEPRLSQSAIGNHPLSSAGPRELRCEPGDPCLNADHSTALHSSYHVVMLTVMYEDDMPTADELEQIAGSLLSDGCLGRDDAQRAAHVLRAVAGGLKGALLSDRVSDEGFD